MPSLTEIWKVRHFHVNYLYSPAARSSYRLQMLQFIRQMFNPCFDIHQSLISSVQTILCLCATEANNGEKKSPLIHPAGWDMFFYLMTLDLLIAFQHLSLPLLANDSFSLQSSEKGISYLTNYRELKLVFLNRTSRESRCHPWKWFFSRRKIIAGAVKTDVKGPAKRKTMLMLTFSFSSKASVKRTSIITTKITTSQLC